MEGSHVKAIQELGEVHLCVEVYVQYGDKVLMHKRSPDKLRFPGYLIGPGGHINETENVVIAAVREIEEETGILIPSKSLRLKAVSIHHHLDIDSVWVCWVFLAKPEHLSAEIVSSREGESFWLDRGKIDSVRSKIFPPVLEYIDHVLNNQPGIIYTNSQWDNDKLIKDYGNIVA